MKPNFLYLFIFITIFQLVIDIYVIFKWNKYSKAKKLEPWTRFTPFVISLLMLCASIYSNYYRLHYNSNYNEITYFLFTLTSLWYLPKLLLAIVFILYDFVHYPFKLSKKLFFKKAELNSIAIEPQEKVQSKRRELLGYAGIATASIPFIMVYKGLKGTYELDIKRVVIELNNLPKEFEGFTFAQISDLHAGSFPNDKFIQEIIFKTNLMKPDMVVFTGDFVNSAPEEMLPYAQTLSKFKSEFGTVACLGNHDHYMSDENLTRLKGIIKEMNFDLLVNRSKEIKINNSILNLIGVDNSGMNQSFANFNQAFTNVQEGSPTILLCHDPTNWDKHIKNKLNVDLTLSGHTHGGQIAPNLFGYRLEPASKIYKQYSGLYSEKDQNLYVNVGLGTVGPPIRLGVPPEITIFTLQKAQNLA